MNKQKKYWKSLKELNIDSAFKKEMDDEFIEHIPVNSIFEKIKAPKSDRRSFLKAIGFGVSAVTLAACTEAPIKKAIPYLVKPEEVVLGVANYYVSSKDGLGVLVKSQVGRPIKIDGNPHCTLSQGSVSASIQASLLDLYDQSRLKKPLFEEKTSSWFKIDTFIRKSLRSAQNKSKKVILLSQQIDSPSTLKAIRELKKQYPVLQHKVYNPISYAGIAAANQYNFNQYVIPRYRFDNAQIIVSFDADFLGTWIAPNQFARQYAEKRKEQHLQLGKMSRHIHFEAGLSITGSNADVRKAVPSYEQGSMLACLFELLKGIPGKASAYLQKEKAYIYKSLVLASKELKQNLGQSLVVCGSNDQDIQKMVNSINHLLKNYNKTLFLNQAKPYLKEVDLPQLVQQLASTNIAGVIFCDTNPIYHLEPSLQKNLISHIKKFDFSIALAEKIDETSQHCQTVLPLSSWLEDWGDQSPYQGYYQIVQPIIRKLFENRSILECLITWSSSRHNSTYDYVKEVWEKKILAKTSFNEMLEKGVVGDFTKNSSIGTKIKQQTERLVKDLLQKTKNNSVSEDTELNLYQNVGIKDGKYANNPYLQELPDPISKVTWGNYLAINPLYAKIKKIKEFQLVTVTDKHYSIQLPALFQPGQAMKTVSIALGYGRIKVGQAGNNVGKNVFPFVSFFNPVYHKKVSIKPVPGSYEQLARSQVHNTSEGRTIIRETDFKAFKKNPKKALYHKKHPTYDLWPVHKKSTHRWVMAIDLNACTGCGACIVACNIENNVPVVGKDEVLRRREMHWLRIDRYYSFTQDPKNKIRKERSMDKVFSYEDVEVVHQPMLCQHCDHAPCETVCPVLATTHSSEGLNQMTYNRCVGTRYCANNCPYKVRRFNWFHYWKNEKFDNYLNNALSQLVLNPDVTPRSRGVMEKCTFCVQRIQAGKLTAKKEKRALKDGDIKTACQQTCPTGAIVFGDVHDETSQVSKLLNSNRNYYVLEELNVQPSIGYLTKIRNS